MITIACISLTITIPVKALTCCDQCIGSQTIINSKFQSDRILASLRICKYVIMITIACIGLTITVPGEALTCCDQCISSQTIVNGEFQSDRILASLCICKYIIMITTGGISLAITIPGEALTCCYQCICSQTIINSEFQSDRILATLCICKYVIMITIACIGLPI